MPGSKKIVRLAMVGGLDKNHAQTFSKMINIDLQDAKTQADMKERGFPAMPAEVKISAAWDEDFGKAEELARAYGVDRACRTLDEALTDVDAVFIPDDVDMTHQRWALPVMKRGLPYFHDKPLAPTYREAEEIVSRAREYGAVMFSTSALAYTRELEALSPQFAAEGGVRLAVATGPSGRFLFYGIHPLTAVYSLFGPGVKSVQNTGPAGRHGARVEWENGKTGLFVVDERVKGFSLMVYTEKACHVVRVTDSRYFYYNMLHKFVEMVLTGEIPIPWEHTLEIIKVLDTVEKAAARGDSSVIRF